MDISTLAAELCVRHVPSCDEGHFPTPFVNHEYKTPQCVCVCVCVCVYERERERMRTKQLSVDPEM
jgi:hypothetical protein